MSNEVVIVSAVRNSHRIFFRVIEDVSAPELGGIVIKEALSRSGVNAKMSMKSLWGMCCKPVLVKTRQGKRRLKRTA